MDGRGRIAKAGKFCKQNVARPYNKMAIFLWLLLKQFSCKFFEGVGNFLRKKVSDRVLASYVL